MIGTSRVAEPGGQLCAPEGDPAVDVRLGAATVGAEQQRRGAQQILGQVDGLTGQRAAAHGGEAAPDGVLHRVLLIRLGHLVARVHDSADLTVDGRR